jgi:hypothetical protein
MRSGSAPRDGVDPPAPMQVLRNAQLCALNACVRPSFWRYARRGLNARRLGQLGQEVVIAFPSVAAHDAAQGRVRFECRGVNRESFPLDQPAIPDTAGPM